MKETELVVSIWVLYREHLWKKGGAQAVGELWTDAKYLRLLIILRLQWIYGRVDVSLFLIYLS